jgi:hypothetical protein
MVNDPNNLYNVATGNAAPATLMHVRIDGRSRDIALDVLGITDTSTDQDIREALARFMELPLNAFDRTIVERHANGNITVRPEALFG